MPLVGTRDDAPLHAVPVFDQWQATGAPGEEDPDGPDVAGRDFLYAVQDIARRA